MELVEFNLTRSLRIESVFINARRISGKSRIWRCAFQNNFDGFLFIWNRVCCLRIWTTCEQCFWRNQQKILPIIINFAQQPVNIEFFGNISCNRLVFKSVSWIYWNSLLKIVLIFFQPIFGVFHRLSIMHFHISWCSGNSANETSKGSESSWLL